MEKFQVNLSKKSNSKRFVSFLTMRRNRKKPLKKTIQKDKERKHPTTKINLHNIKFRASSASLDQPPTTSHLPQENKPGQWKSSSKLTNWPKISRIKIYEKKNLFSSPRTPIFYTFPVFTIYIMRSFWQSQKKFWFFFPRAQFHSANNMNLKIYLYFFLSE